MVTCIRFDTSSPESKRSFIAFGICAKTRLMYHKPRKTALEIPDWKLDRMEVHECFGFDCQASLSLPARRQNPGPAVTVSLAEGGGEILLLSRKLLQWPGRRGPGPRPGGPSQTGIFYQLPGSGCPDKTTGNVNARWRRRRWPWPCHGPVRQRCYHDDVHHDGAR